MDKNSKVRELLRKITGTDTPLFNFRLMEVVSVDGDLCTAKLGEFEIPDIRLSPIEGGSENGILIIPAIGSIVIVADLSCGQLRELFVMGYTEIDSVRIHKGTTTVMLNNKTVDIQTGSSMLHMEDGKIQFNGEENGGLVKISELRNSLNSLKTYCETLKGAVSSGLNAIGAGTAANGATGAGAFDAAMASLEIQIENMENKKVTH